MITQSRLKELLNYDPETGVFIRIIQRKKFKEGTVAGCVNTDGYIEIKINKKSYLAHRLAWLFFYGKFPDKDCDHKNGIRSDNRIKNLRDATSKVNAQNRIVAHSNNKTGLLGVNFGNYILDFLF